MPTTANPNSRLGNSVFSLPAPTTGDASKKIWGNPVELSTTTLAAFTQPEVNDDDGPVPSGRRKATVIRDADLIVAAGSELRITPLGDAKLGVELGSSYTVLETPEIQYEVTQLALNPSGRLLAVAGKRHVTVVVLPRSGFSKRSKGPLECKSVQVGQYYHGSRTSIPIAKVEWHPWGEAGSTLMVMTVDGKLREYDISADAEEPQQTISFLPERKSHSIVAEDPSEREVASFCLGKGAADWGPLTVYAVMRSGDLYAVCPYMPKNASVPSAYVHALECFVAAKQEFLISESSSSKSDSADMAAMYDYQRKYVSALLKQLPPGTVFPAVSRSVLMHPPKTIKNLPAVQGPFLLQPAPRQLEGSDGGDATDVVHLAFSSDVAQDEDREDDAERLGVVLIAYQDGRVDVCLDVEKVEATWDVKRSKKPDLPMLAVYETIDLGLVKALIDADQKSSLLELLQANYPVLYPDPIYDDLVYIYHAFGVHVLDLGGMLNSLMEALRRRDDDAEDAALVQAIAKSEGTSVQPIVSTFSVEHKCSNPVIALTVPNDVYLSYSIFVLTSAMRIVSFPLALRTGPAAPHPPDVIPSPPPPPANTKDTSKVSAKDPLPYVSLLGSEPFTPPASLTKTANGLPATARLVLPPAPKAGPDFQLTPEILRYLGTTVERFRAQIHAVQLAHRDAEVRAQLQLKEFSRQQETAGHVLGLLSALRTKRLVNAGQRVEGLKERQTQLLGRMDRLLKALMQKASPELSEHEMRWFEELNRMKEEVTGAGRYDDSSLSARTQTLQREFDKLKPSLESIKEVDHRKKVGNADPSLGYSQAIRLAVEQLRSKTKFSI